MKFIRSDLAQLKAYTPHPGGESTRQVDQLDTNESPYDLPPEFKEKLAWLYQNQVKNNRYPDGGHQVLKSAIAEYVTETASLKTPLTALKISVGNGSDELIRSLLIATCVGGEGAILVANPTFSMYGIIAQTLGVPVLSVERNPDDFSINLDQAKTALENTQNPPIRAVFVVHPNSPTSNALTPAEIDWLRRLSEDILVVIDEAYFEFSQTSLVEELDDHSNWVILRTFSKAFRLAALRVGYAIGHPLVITALEKVRLPYNLPSFSQLAAQLALEQRQVLLPSIKTILQERDKLYEKLSQLSPLEVWPSDANFFYVRLRGTDLDSPKYSKIQQTLKANGTLIRHTGGGFRITVGTPDENQRTIARLKQVL
ncbi:histidinol-phosphate transaminase [Spirulina sp. CS-785/01]|uniref:histidinol-phosphate transaminase n=1 Tax=Spirulina sp. CS-785/01 TaxID=3021716 RepID=UPI00232FE00F|nr:histidinol-phosphate transaminase [Spirulina sp. CS-785/01]MDB9312443.1 histidinol-phosphate transaminase [Spirulina sp. CS-785/01]